VTSGAVSAAAAEAATLTVRHISSALVTNSSRHDNDGGSSVSLVASDRSHRCRSRRAPATGLLLRPSAAANSRRTHENVE